jgi:uncharacterized protein (TIGR00297 family)
VNPALAVGLASGLAAVGWRLGWLSAGGTAAAVLVGGGVFAGAGWRGAVLLALFFISGSLLSRWNEKRSGPARRSARQVLANGLWAAAGAALTRADPVPAWAVLTGALASAQSDTWATEIGAHSRRPPRLITSWRRVPPGTSGGVSGAGTAAGLLGGTLLAGVALALGIPRGAALAGLAGGLLGMTADSVLGATVQGRFHCPVCLDDTELRRHHCGSRATPVRGWSWLDNDGVNLVANGIAAATAWGLVTWF